MVKRLDFLDLAKGIGILLVVLGHIYNDNGAKAIIYSFHMPLFFIIVGIIYGKFNEKYNSMNIKQFFKKRIKNIMIPYLIFCFLLVIFNVVRIIALKEFSYDAIMAEVRAVCILDGRGALWFLPCLVISELMFLIFNKSIKNINYRNLIIYSISIIALFLNTDSDILMVWIRPLVALGFINFGFNIANIDEKIQNKYFFIILLGGIGIIAGLSNGVVDLYSLIYNNKLLYVIGSLSGSIAVILLCVKIKSNKFIHYLGVNTLIIMGTHQLILPIVFKAYVVVTKYEMNSGVHAIVGFTIIMFTEVIILIMFDKFKNIYKKRKIMV